MGQASLHLEQSSLYLGQSSLYPGQTTLFIGTDARVPGANDFVPRDRRTCTGCNRPCPWGRPHLHQVQTALSLGTDTLAPGTNDFVPWDRRACHCGRLPPPSGTARPAPSTDVTVQRDSLWSSGRTARRFKAHAGWEPIAAQAVGGGFIDSSQYDLLTSQG